MQVPIATALALGMQLDGEGRVVAGTAFKRGGSALGHFPPGAQVRWASEGPFAWGEGTLAQLQLYGLHYYRPQGWPQGWVVVTVGMC